MTVRFVLDLESEAFSRFEEQTLLLGRDTNLVDAVANAIHEIRLAPTSVERYPFPGHDIRVRNTESTPQLLIAYGLERTLAQEYPDDECWAIVPLLVRYRIEIATEDDPELIETALGVRSRAEGRDHPPRERLVEALKRAIASIRKYAWH